MPSSLTVGKSTFLHVGYYQFEIDKAKGKGNCKECNGKIKIGEKRLTIASPNNFPYHYCTKCTRGLIEFLATMLKQ